MLVELAGVLAGDAYARSQDEWNFVKSLAHGEGDTSEIRNVAIGVNVPASKGKPAVVARSMTCYHATKKCANFTVFFRWRTKPAGTKPGSIVVVGYGNHIKAKGNKQTKYSVLWADGTTNTIELDEKSAAGAAFLAQYT